MLLADLAATSQAVAATSKRTEKLALLAARLREAAPDEVAAVASYLSGELRQRRTGVGWRSLQGLPAPATAATLTVIEVDAAFAAMASLSGPGSTATRAALLEDLWSRATAVEQQMLAGLVSGELRQGASVGLLTDAVARAADLPLALVRRALTLSGSLTEVAAAALTGQSLEDFALVVGRGLSPMLAATATDLDDALSRMTMPVAVDWKLDGVRVQVHRTGPDVRVLSRSLDDLTTRMPELVTAALSLPVTSVVLDGEALVVDAEDRPLPFQVTASRAMSVVGAGLRPWWFDVLHLDGRDLLDEPLSVRDAVLTELVPSSQRVPRLITSSAAAAHAFATDALAKGHEGVVVKAVDAPYEAGRRGGSWLKVKPRHTLDLVVLAVEHGHGRRREWLSNLHLGARHGDGFVMLGKTFKGLTDELLRWQTARFRELEVEDDGWVVTVRPEQVVEIAFDGVQTSTRYPGGVALRFARVLRYRDDKAAAEADTLDDVLRLRT
ncbi:MAG: ATP-dependent ligase [Frankiales bacterium]|nr:ATP-dependent ligase [Frankiales bacterium]